MLLQSKKLSRKLLKHLLSELVLFTLHNCCSLMFIEFKLESKSRFPIPEFSGYHCMFKSTQLNFNQKLTKFKIKNIRLKDVKKKKKKIKVCVLLPSWLLYSSWNHIWKQLISIDTKIYKMSTQHSDIRIQILKFLNFKGQIIYTFVSLIRPVEL